MQNFKIILYVSVFPFFLSACSEIPRTPPPAEKIFEISQSNYQPFRATAGRLSDNFMDDLVLSYQQESEDSFIDPNTPTRKLYPHLVLSGGGPNGAFGAGLLAGWSEQERPTFKIVTGVSTGALMAPFAFLGSEYDDELFRFYTTTKSGDIFLLSNPFFRLLFSDSFADTTPLQRLIELDVDMTLLSKIAKEHDNGRRLYVATSNLDAQSLMIWNMGVIAKIGNKEALELFRKVMLASASIPVAFPPVMFDVEHNGVTYDELHVDGAVGANMFYSGGVFNTVQAREKAGIINATEAVYIIHNGQLGAVADPTNRSIAGIAARTFDSVTKAAAIGDIHRIYATSLRQNYDFAWITIPLEVDLTEAEQIFDPNLMRKLYDAGFELSQPTIPWRRLPPGIQE
ncbi:patatin-like phospholipase family protein [Thorsellia anophelis]|uniref:Predicted acylesterase/phospholipase RssA, contains patatin domain n=1 Tax=Thorsellia anophelis DSM 18579 TaxID=1123402 RepID=A0A1I0C034_9GAMM|nr:patatin-like phospholipase family protein [Thorsellia anophelis]SET12078.1 Predicted acylesterase/phospholipase RssA, contains patatin domain [Thorsellia anophelis DSM 18579]